MEHVKRPFQMLCRGGWWGALGPPQLLASWPHGPSWGPHGAFLGPPQALSGQSWRPLRAPAVGHLKRPFQTLYRGGGSKDSWASHVGRAGPLETRPSGVAGAAGYPPGGNAADFRKSLRGGTAPGGCCFRGGGPVAAPPRQ